jgi:phosphate uptake regulator
MKRKVVKLGPTTLVVSLPSKWAKEFNIDAGKEIDINEEEGRLVIQTERKPQKKEIAIEINNENKHNLKHILTHIYRKGYDKIRINYETETSKEIKDITNSILLGFEVTQKDDTHCIIENIAEPTDQKYDVILKRLFFTIKETQKTIMKDFDSGKYTSAKDVNDLKDQQDRFVLFCKRILYQKNDRNTLFQYELLTFLMHIEHAYYYMYKYASENKVKIDEKSIELQMILIEYFELFFNGYFNKDMKSLYKIQKLSEEYQYGKCFKYLENAKGKNAVIYSYSREIFRLIQIGTSPIKSDIIDHLENR